MGWAQSRRRVDPLLRALRFAVARVIRLVVLAVLVGVPATCLSCLYGRIMYYGMPSLSAPTYFDNRMARATDPRPLRRSSIEPDIRVRESSNATYASFEDLLRDNETRAFLWIRDDAVVYERYFDGVVQATQLPSFSMSKTFAALLVGCAIQDGLIRSEGDRLVAYVPELSARQGYPDITIEHLLRMTSGIDFVEDSFAGAALYYSTDLRARMYSYDVKWPPGSRYVYGSVGTQLLWDVLHRRLEGKSVTRYFEERVWAPLGAEHAALWSLDSRTSGIEKLFGGFSATTRDHARIGLLFLHGGTIDGHVIVPPEWVRVSVLPDPVAGVVHTTDGNVRRGHYQWFLSLDGRSFFAKGYHGQYVFVVPDRKSVFVRFGDEYGSVDWPSLFMRLADTFDADSLQNPVARVDSSEASVSTRMQK